MADTFTTNLNLTKPEPGAAEDTWGISLNSDLDTLDAIFSSSGTQVNLNPNQVNFADNKKAIFGTGSDLQIYHTGTQNYIEDAGTGNLNFKSNGNFFNFLDGSNNLVFQIDLDSATKLYHNTSEKLTTTSSGVNVNGTVTSDQLVVDGNTSSQTYRSSRTDGDVYIQATTDTDFVKIGTQTKINILQVDGSGDISFYDDTGTTQGLFWDASTERLGIGTTSPSELLHIYNSGGAGNDANVLIEANGSGVNAKLTIDGHASGGQLDLTYRSDTQSKTVAMRCLNDGSFRIDTLGSEAMRIVGDNVGIGTTSPSGLLEISADSDDGTSAPSFLITNASTTLNDGAVVGTIEFRNSDASGTPPHTAKIQGIANASDERTTELAFSTGSVGTTTERLRINSTGNVGIGTDNPSAVLHVKNSSPSFLLQNSSETGRQTKIQHASGITKISSRNNASNGVIAFEGYTASTTQEYGRFDSSGNLGIGTSSPARRLSVVGSTRPAEFGSDNAVNVVKLYNSATGSSTYNGLDLSVNSTSNANINAYGMPLTFKTSASNGTNVTERMRIDSSGNVGIGTDSPTSTLTVDGDARIEKTGAASRLVINRYDLNTADSSTIDLLESSSQGASFGNAGVYGYRLELDGSTNNLNIKSGNATTVSTRLSIERDTGNVGINTGSPAKQLHVYQPSGQTGIVLSRTNNIAGVNLQFSVDSSKTRLLSYGDALSFWTAATGSGTNASEKARIDPSGNLLVGTTSQISAGKITVSGGTAASGITATTDATAGYAAASFQRTASVGTAVQFKQGASEVGSISVTSSTTAYNTSSDARLKDVTGEARGLEVITKLNPVAYNWKADGKADEGLIAQEVKEIVPNAVSGSEDEHYQMDYSKLVTPLVKAVQELEQQVTKLKSEIAKLKGE